MNLDDLVNSISENDLKLELSHWVYEWKTSEEDTNRLASLIEKWHGNVWFKNTDESNLFYVNYQKFKSEAIDGIGGLTLNERIYWFALFEIWDSASPQMQQQIRYKLHAKA